VQVGTALLLTWLPLLILAGAQGMAPSFIQDVGVQARFLIALPILLVFSGRISAELGNIVGHFVGAKLVTEAERARFDFNVASAMRFSHSRLAEGLILILVYAVQALFVLALVTSKLPLSWRVLGSEGHRVLSLAGLWFTVISEPVYGFVLCRFLYRIALWWIFLWKTSRLDLQLDGSHPDAAGGIGFLGLTLDNFKEVAFAVSTSFAGGLANIVLRTGSGVGRYKFEILALIVVSVGLFAGPLFFFYSLLVRTRFRDTLRYWKLWQGQRRQFEPKWLRDMYEYPDMLAIQDFSEVTDLSQVLERVQQMSIVPFRRAQVWPLLLAAMLPFVVVMSIDVPIEEMILRVV
jgi:hypothetical protein